MFGPAKTKHTKPGLITIGLLCFAICLPSAASARTHFYAGIGYHHYYPGFRSYCHPHYNWIDRDYYGWLDGPWCRDPYVFGCGHYHWGRHLCTSGIGFWVEDWGPNIIVESPIVEVPGMIVKKEVIVKTRENNYESNFDENTLKLFEQLRCKKGELLEKLRLEDKEERKKAIAELAGFSFDDKVRKALEDILLSDPEPELRKEAAKSFGKVKNRLALSVLEKARVEDSDREVCQEADKAIKKIKEP
jgi:hypothetical protein